MTMLDPAERSQRGAEAQRTLLAAAAPEPKTLFESSWRDFVFSEVWTRPGLDLRSRFLISIAGVYCVETPPDIAEAYIRGALSLKHVTLGEFREAALHLAIYAGWSAGAALDAAITRVAKAMGLPPAALAPLHDAPWDPATLRNAARAKFEAVTTFAAPAPITPFLEIGILDFTFGELWTRPGLDQRGRRWICLVAAGQSSSETPINSHVYGALKSGDATLAEMHEFVLQYAIHGGWPHASVMQGAVLQMAERIKQGLPFP